MTNLNVVVRKRGRPPGSKNKKTAGEVKPRPAVVAPTVDSGIIPKKRGRPPKNPLQTAAAIKPEFIPQEIPILESKLISIVNKPKEETKVQEPKSYKQFEVGDRVKKTTTGDVGYVKVHKPDTRYVYVNWGGDYMDFVAADLLELINIPASKRQKKE